MRGIVMREMADTIYFYYITRWTVNRATFDATLAAAVQSHWCGYVLLRDGIFSPSFVDVTEHALRKIMAPL